MTSGTDYVRQYGKANAAYCRGDLKEAATVINELAQDYPDDPHVLLLRGHIFLSLQQYSKAQQEYQTVLQICDQPDLVDYAQKGLQQIELARPESEEMEFSIDETEGFAVSEPNFEVSESFSQEGFPSWPEAEDNMDWNNMIFSDEEMGDPTMGVNPSHSFANPFTQDLETSFNGDLPNFDDLDETFGLPSEPSNYPDLERYINSSDSQQEEETNFSWHNGNHTDDYDSNGQIPNFENFADAGDSTFVVSSDLQGTSLRSPSGKFFPTTSGSTEQVPYPNQSQNPDNFHQDGWNNQNFQSSSQQRPQPVNSEGFLEDLEAFNEDDLDGLSQFDITDVAQSLPDSGLFERHTQTDGLESGLETGGVSAVSIGGSSISKINWTDVGDNSSANLTGASTKFIKPTVEVDQGRLAAIKNLPLKKKQWVTATAAGVASVVTIFLVSSAIWILSPKSTAKPDSTSNKVSLTQKKSQKQDKKPTSNQDKNSAKATASKPPSASQATPSISPFSSIMLWMMLCTGGVTFGTTFLFTRLSTHQIKQTVDDLQSKFDDIYSGNFNVKATVYSEDELGQLSARFNQMAQVILTTTSEAQRRAAETEQQKEDLQRQVIRLLDDVEGAARGDLTVEAEVTADVLGAVADAFNLTINNLREIVRQVKKAAEQVNRSSTDSELYARNQSSDALRMAEELAVTLNSVQMMTDSIQRVAENAREAEEVARTSSVTALKGGESVERTVAGILQIRETVSETARKVKRLAEASQEINKIVAVVSQIASRTNLLALNASIQAARAGEAGRGFAIVADEVRQLADRSAKSLKEIEQIVLQIQSETGSVMTAMEEGIQQVIDVTERSEQAKRSLEDIIQVSNRIDSLVRSITGDTVKQRENSREVAQVMQSVELTAQETSQESQRVAGSLQKLVKISRDLLESVERFKVDKNEHK